MVTKQSNLSIKAVGLDVSAALAVPYALIMFASLLLVSLGTTRSWQAAFLGIGWSTVAGFEIGLLVIVIVGLGVSVAFVPTYNFIRRRVSSRSNNVEPLSQSGRLSTGSRAFRLLTALFVLLPLILLVLRMLATAMPFAVATGDDAANQQGPDVQTQAMNIGSVINTVHRESEPSFTADGRTMYFNCNSGDICVSHLTGTWEEGNWTAPEMLDAPISTVYEDVEPVINATGDKLYFTSRRPGYRWWGISFLSPFMDVFRVVNTLSINKLGRTFFGGLGLADIYVSYWIDGAWSEPRSLNDVAGEPPINTPFHDHCLFFSTDGKEAFWTSTRPGGFGENDIWSSRLVDGRWTEPENLGPNVNGPGSEHSPIPTPDGRSLYVTAARSDGFGDDDIYITTRGVDGAWGPLINLGPIVNGPGDDRCAVWTPDLKIFLFDSVREGGYGSRDVWWVYFKDIMGFPLAATSTAEPVGSSMSSQETEWGNDFSSKIENLP